MKLNDDSNIEDRIDNIETFKTIASKFTNLDELLEYVDKTISESNKNNSKLDKVKMMTIHKSKGMEFPVVFLVGVNKDLLPHKKAENIEEVENASKKTDTKNNSEIEKSELTDNDVMQGLYNAISEKLGIPYYYFCIIANIVTTNTVWVQRWDSDNASELDVLVFTYTVDNDVVTVSDPTEEKLTVSVSEINNKIAELNANIEKQNTSLVEASSKVKELSTQIAELTPFKEAADKAEKERIEAETASKREELKNHALKSGFIIESEFESDDNIKASIDNVSQKDLDAIIAERFIASLNKKESNVETSSKEKEAKKIEESTAKLNLSNSETKPVNYKEIMESFLSK